MYWIYLVIFILIVFVPDFVTHGTYIFDVAQMQEIALLFLSSLGLTLFLLQENKLKKNLAEKYKIQSQVNRMSKDLRFSYSYIGEINRKLDILENIATTYPESTKLTQKNKNELCDSIMSAIGIFAKSNEYAIRFVHLPNYEILKEIKSVPENSLNFSLKGKVIESNYYETSQYIVMSSPRIIDNIFSYILIKKRTPSQKIDDKEIMRALAAQALLLYMFIRKKTRSKLNI